MEGHALKRKILLSVVLTAVLCSGAAYAESKYKLVEVFMQQIGISVNGQTLGREADSLVYQGTIYVPLRHLSELLGAEVSWDGQNRNVNLDFLNDQSALLRSAADQGVYQYLAIQNNLITQGLIDTLKADDMEAMKAELLKYDELREIAEESGNEDLAEQFSKLQAAGEIMRGAYAVKNMDEFYLGYEIFNSSARAIHQALQNGIEAD